MWSIKTDDEYQATLVPLVEGDYDFEVTKVEEKESKAGNYMVALQLKVYMSNGQTVICKDWIVDIDSQFYKRKSFWSSVGYPQHLNALAEYYSNRSGKAHFKVEEFEGANGPSKQLRVGYYIAQPSSLDGMPVKTLDEFEDDIDF